MGEINFKQDAVLASIKGTQHGFFTKNGGVSTGVYSSLNCSPSSDDSPENILENRQRVMQALGMQKAKLFGLSQIHSKHIHHIKTAQEKDFPEGDALITTKKGIALSVLGADCTPVLFASKNGKVIAAAHAGWRGAVSGIVEAVVLKMIDLGEKRENIVASIGPTIDQAAYEVQDDFINELTALSDFKVDEFLHKNEAGTFFDLPAYLLKQCQRSGIEASNIGLDTYQLSDDFFSYRRNTHQKLHDYGRQISVIGLTAE